MLLRQLFSSCCVALRQCVVIFYGSCFLLFLASMNLGAGGWGDAPSMKHYSPELQAIIGQHDSLEAKIEADGVKSILDIWESAFNNPALLKKTAYEGLGITLPRVHVGVRHELTYAEVSEKTEAIASYLINHTPLAKGSRVALMMPSSPQLVMSFIGVVRAGMVPMIVLTAGEPKELGALLARELLIGKPHCLFAMETNTEAVEIALRDIEPGGTENWVPGNIIKVMAKPFDGEGGHVLRKAAHAFANKSVAKEGKTKELEGAVPFDRVITVGKKKPYVKPDIKPDDAAFMQFTSGTTGDSKAIVISHKNMLTNAYQIKLIVEEKLKDHPYPRMYQPLPTTHSFGAIMTCVVGPMLGAHTFLVINPKDSETLIGVLEKAQPDVVFAVDRLLEKLMSDEIKGRCKAVFAGKKPALTVAGASSISERTRKAWHELSGCRITEGFGASEVTVAVALEITEDVDNPLSTGLVALPGVDCIVLGWQPGQTIGANFSEGDYPAKELTDNATEGQLLISGDHVSGQYFENPEATAESFVKDSNGKLWWVSGDLVKMQDGRFWVTGRAKETIIVNGQNITPPKIENAAKSHPNVQQAIAFAIPKDPADAAGDDFIGLFVITDGEALTSETLVEHMRTQQVSPLEGYEVPKAELVVVRESEFTIPRTQLFKEKRVKMKMGLIKALTEKSAVRENPTEKWSPEEVSQVFQAWIDTNEELHIVTP